MSATADEIVEAVARRVLELLTDPPAGDDPVVRYGDPGEIRADFEKSVGMEIPAHAPPHEASLVTAAADAVMRWSVHTSHPRFVNQNFAGADPVAVVGDWMGAVLNTTNATYEVAPVFTLMERAVLVKLAGLAGFAPAVPDAEGAETERPDTEPPPGLFCPGGSTATLYALQLARHRADPDLVRVGDTGGPYAVFVSSSGHYSVKKAAALLGMGTEAVVEVDTDAAGAMVPEALDDAIAATTDRRPLAVVATAGTTVTAAFDPLDAVADLCDRHGLWLHVDGCYGASALFSPVQRARLAGVERADSLVWDLHKMMGTTQQCSVLLLQDSSRLDPCFAIGADYLFQPDKRNAALDSGDRTFQCGRRVDALKLWLSWKVHGDEGFARRVDHAVAVADHVRDAVDRSDGRFLALVPGDFTNVCLLWMPPELRGTALEELDDTTRARLHALAPRVKGRMLDAGSAMIGYQPVHGINAFRLLFMNPRVGIDDAQALLSLIDRYAVEEWAS